MPVSGLIKNGNWLPVNLIFFITSFFPIQLTQYNPIWSEASMRSLQTVIPALAAVIWIFTWSKNQNWKAISRDTGTIISALAVYVVIKGMYNLVLVYLMGQGHWYYSISIMIFNLIAAVVVAESSQRDNIPASKNLARNCIFVAGHFAGKYICLQQDT